MDQIKKNILKHNFTNSVVIISSLAKTASKIANKISLCSFEENILTKRQLEIFSQSMTTIQNEIDKIKIYVENLDD